MIKNSSLKIILFVILSVWMVIIFHEFIIPNNSILSIAGIYFNHLTSHVCHQEPAKLFWSGNSHSSVCARCSGIYSGAFIGSLLLIFNIAPKIKNKYLFLALILLLLDVLLVNADIYSYLKSTAYFSGIILGCISFFYLYESLENLFLQKKPGLDK